MILAPSFQIPLQIFMCFFIERFHWWQDITRILKQPEEKGRKTQFRNSLCLQKKLDLIPDTCTLPHLN